MATFHRSTDPRKPPKAKRSADYIPLRKVRRESHSHNIWTEDSADADISVSLRGDRSRVSWEDNAVGRKSLESHASWELDDLDADQESAARLIQGTVRTMFLLLLTAVYEWIAIFDRVPGTG
jgi:hypothetical protein